MPGKISILKESGETVLSNIVSVFMIPDTEKRYIITTENAVDPHGLTVLHVSEIVDGSLQKVATDDEWSTIKTIMRAIISGNVGSYQYIPSFDSINANGTYSRDISVSASAAKQMVDNYNAGEKNGATLEQSSTPNPEEANPTGPVLVQNDVPSEPQQVSPNSIFPSNGTVVSNDEEVVPGIAELNQASVPMSTDINQPITPGVNDMNQPVVPGAIDINNQPVPPVNGDSSIIQPLIQPVIPGQEQAPEQPTVEPPQIIQPVPPIETPIAPISPVPEEPASPIMNNVTRTVVVPSVGQVNQAPSPAEIQAQETQNVAPIEIPIAEGDTQIISPMGVSQPIPDTQVVIPEQPQQPIAETTPNLEQTNTGITPNLEQTNIGVTPNIEQNIQPVMGMPNPSPVMQPMVADVNNTQVTSPATMIPNAQIAQGVQMHPMPNFSFNPNVNPNFAPNASLDEVVVGAQEMFMAGVQNLVQTIQEKVYRDLYNKEEELKNREMFIKQKEQMINSQMLAMMNNFSNSYNSMNSQMMTPAYPQMAPMSNQPIMNNNQMMMPPFMQQQMMQNPNNINN